MPPYFHTTQFTVVFKVQYYVSIFQCVCHSKESVPSIRLCAKFCTMLIFYGVELLPPRSTPKVEDHPLSVIRYSLFSLLAANIHTWGPSHSGCVCLFVFLVEFFYFAAIEIKQKSHHVAYGNAATLQQLQHLIVYIS